MTNDFESEKIIEHWIESSDKDFKTMLDFI